VLRLLVFLLVLLAPAGAAPAERFLDLPPGDRPFPVQAHFHLYELTRIDDEAESFEFTGVLRMTWRDTRQAFDPKAAGVAEKVYTGNFQVDEVSPAWYPQLQLVNGSGTFEVRGVLLRVKPDGTTTLIQSILGSAHSRLSMRRYPFDSQQLHAGFQVLGFTVPDVLLTTTPATGGADVKLSQWRFDGVSAQVREFPSASGVSSTLVVTLKVKRFAMYMVRLVVLPMILIVAATWVVFWMDRGAVGDRINVSFVGILTVVAYQIVVAGILPQISYVTLMNAIINLCFGSTILCVVANLRVDHFLRTGRPEVAESLDRRYRWLFPALFFGALVLMLVVAFVLGD